MCRPSIVGWGAGVGAFNTVYGARRRTQHAGARRAGLTPVYRGPSPAV